ncbi:ROK family transcriptional regulator [Sodalis sp. RH22]|uniref:ROK family transcriptional regulator n=1 Tax=unclassified Sodalis (in: enterobacteria) TaxID=2636512 RepID=UPI0039B67E73
MMNEQGKGRNTVNIREYNRSLIIHALSRHGRMSRSDIAKTLSLSEAAISRIVRELIEDDLISEAAPQGQAQGPGRRQVPLALSVTSKFIISVCLTAFEHCVSIINLRGQQLARSDLTDTLKGSGNTVVEDLIDKIDGVLSENNISKNKIIGIGVVTIGAVDKRQGKICISSIHVLNNQLITHKLGEFFKVPVYLGTIGEALSIGEKVFSEKRPLEFNSVAPDPYKSKDATLLIYIAFGIGAYVLINGIAHGNINDDRLIAHIPVLGADDLCLCGARGCLLTKASGYSLVKQSSGDEYRFAPILLDEIEPGKLLNLISRLNAGDKKIEDSFFAAGVVLGEAIFSLSVCFTLKTIVLSGVVGQVQAYQRGVSEGVKNMWRRLNIEPPFVRINDLGYGAIAELYSLEQVLFGEGDPIKTSIGITSV